MKRVAKNWAIEGALAKCRRGYEAAQTMETPGTRVLVTIGGAEVESETTCRPFQVRGGAWRVYVKCVPVAVDCETVTPTKRAPQP